MKMGRDPVTIPGARLRCLVAAGMLLWSILAPSAALAQSATPGEIQFVFGSDTSTSGFDLDDPSTRYNAGGYDLYAAPTGNAARVMEDAFRDRNRDFFGDPVRLTWWMQAGSLYGTAENTNVPLGSTMSPYRMRKYQGDAISRHGDEFTFHYHTWVWSDYDGDGRWYWNQALSFDETREDFDLTMARMLLEEDTFPVSFRSGWHFMDDAWQARLDGLVPFSMHNDWPHVRNDVVEPTDNIYDWSRSPSDFVPFHPATDDYQVPGDGRSWNVRSIYFSRATDALLRQVFDSARAGTGQVVCIWSHLAETTFVDDLQAVLDRIAVVAADYPDVPYRFPTAVEAMQRWLGTEDATPPALTVQEVPSGGGTLLRITTDEPIFQTAPFVALKDRYERHLLLPVSEVGPNTWETGAFDPAATAMVRVAVTDTVGNLTKHTVRFLPDDVYVDNADPGFSAVSGMWAPVGTPGPAHVWGNDIAATVLSEGAEAAARFELPLAEQATYNVFVRMPAVSSPADRVQLELRAGGQVAATRLFEEAPAPGQWHFVGTADLAPADAPFVELRASGDGQSGAVLAADAVRATALVRERQLDLPLRELDFADVIAGEESTVSLAVRNLGIGALTILGIQTASGVLTPLDSPPYVLQGPVLIELPMRLSSPTIGVVRDTLIVYSDDPIEPVRGVPFQVTFRDWFAVADNDDPASYEESGTWNTSVTQAYGPSSRYAGLPSGWTSTASFAATAQQGGVFDAAYIVPTTVNAAVRADYLVSVDGVRVDSVRIDQNRGSGAWRTLGLYELEAGAVFRVTVRASDPDQSGRVLRADAFRLSRMGDELRTAVLDDADPENYEEAGTWLSSNSQAYGTSSRYASQGSGATATFRASAEVTGVHALHEIVPTTVNASTQAQYRVLRNGVLVESLVIDQNQGSGAWRALGAWLFSAGDEIAVEVSEAPGSTGVLRADAIRVDFGAASDVAVERDLPLAGWSLGPNWPNPFGGRTRFAYSVGAPGRVVVELYDVLGRRVGTVVDEVRQTGTHEAEFDASGLSSGVYLARLRGPGFHASRTWIVAR
jgi:hypothetical protein